MTDATTPDDKPATNVFMGSKGLRAGWGALAYFILVIMLSAALVIALQVWHLVKMPHMEGHTLTPVLVFFQDGTSAAVLIVATVIMVLAEKRSPGQLGFGMANFLPRMLLGLVMGFGALSAVVGILYLCHALVIDKIALTGTPAMVSAGMWSIAFVLVGISEEMMFRGYLQQTLARGMNFRIAALILNALFVLAHKGNAGENPLGLIQVFVAGILLSWSIWRTGTMWWAIGFHAAWDWAQSFFYGVPDSGFTSTGTFLVAHPAGPEWLSGGSAGPEGSVVATGVLIVTGVLIAMFAPKQDVKLDMKW